MTLVDYLEAMEESAEYDIEKESKLDRAERVERLEATIKKLKDNEAESQKWDFWPLYIGSDPDGDAYWLDVGYPSKVSQRPWPVYVRNGNDSVHTRFQFDEAK